MGPGRSASSDAHHNCDMRESDLHHNCDMRESDLLGVVLCCCYRALVFGLLKILDLKTTCFEVCLK